MKNILILLIVVCVGFISCDGRKSKSVALKESIKEFNKQQSNFETVSYYPEDYTEVVTDTIISNALKVHIKNYSVENGVVLMKPSEKKSSNKTKYHRVFESEIIVSSSTKTIFNGKVSANQFKVKSNDVFWNNATLQHAWVNQELSTSEYIQVDVSFINPKDKSSKLYRMTIDANGQQDINLIEENS